MSTRSDQRKDAAEHGLYDPAYEHDACGVGFVASVKGQASHEIVTQALQILKNLDHRGAVGADPLCGDGAGILIQIPDAFFRAEMAKQNILLPPAGDYGVGMIFLPREHASRRACEQELERVVKAEGQVVLGWRDVPRRHYHQDVEDGFGDRPGHPPDLYRPRPRRHGAERFGTQALRNS